MTKVVRFSFALTPRMRTWLEVRDALVCLRRARDPWSWLHAAMDLRASLLGEHGRKPALPDLMGLIAAIREAVADLGERHPDYADRIRQTCERLDGHASEMRGATEAVCHFLLDDALILAWQDAQKKQDFLGHRPGLPEGLPALWEGREDRIGRLAELGAPLQAAFGTMSEVLYGWAPWEKRMADDGTDQITPARSANFGLMAVAVPREDVQAGVMPEISGNRLAIRLRFLRWRTGAEAVPLDAPQRYALMLVPIG
ncbi:MAG: hypothetical protein R8K47_00200 [Mariprofundaceae bacterium]